MRLAKGFLTKTFPQFKESPAIIRVVSGWQAIGDFMLIIKATHAYLCVIKSKDVTVYATSRVRKKAIEKAADKLRKAMS